MLHVYKIDACEDNSMLFWKAEDRELLNSWFCGKDRYYPNKGGTLNLNLDCYSRFFGLVKYRHLV